MYLLINIIWKKWSISEINEAINFNENGFKYEEIAEKLNRTIKSVKLKLNRLGYFTKESAYYENVICECCGENFKSLKTDKRKYCSQSCSGTINGSKFPKRISAKHNNINCLNCGKKLENSRSIFCSKKCNADFKKNEKFEKIKNGDTTLYYGQYKKYLIHLYGEKCMKCGWSEINEFSGKVPIELEHIDGNSENNSLKNLKLLCPNCHSLTSTYKALNVGNGRHSRLERFRSGKSY